MAAPSPSRIDLPAAGWEARPYQKGFWHAMEKGTKRAVLVWHRRSGKDQCSINWTACSSAQRVGTYWHVLPTLKQGRKVVWEGIDKHGKLFLDAFPRDYVVRRREDEMKYWFVNRSAWQIIGADEADVSNLGTNPIGVVFSEFSLTPKMKSLWDFVRPILAENGGWAIFIFTPRGRNHAYKLYQAASQSEDWYDELLTVDDTWYENEEGVRVPVISQEAIELDRASGMSEALIRQEYYCDWEGSLDAAVYGDLMTRAAEEGRICEVPWSERHPVVTAWDFGRADYTSIWFIQEVGGAPHAIDYHEARGEVLEAHLSAALTKPYGYSDHLAPHDAKQLHLVSPHSIYSQAQRFGIHYRIAPKLLVRDGIQAVRTVLPKMRFDAEKCARGIEAMRQYRYQRDERNDSYLETTVHDWASHGADAMRIYATGRRVGAWEESRPLYSQVAIV